MAEYRKGSQTVYAIKYHFVWITKYRYQVLKGRSSRILQDEYPILKKKYWGQHMWGRGYFCGTVGEVDLKTIEEYIKNQGREDPNDNFTIVP